MDTTPQKTKAALRRPFRNSSDFSWIFWSGRRDSNPRPQPWQGCALPLSYTRIHRGGVAAGAARFMAQSFSVCNRRGEILLQSGRAHRLRRVIFPAAHGIKAHGRDNSQRLRSGLRRLCSLAVLPVEMPLLRFQQPCAPWRRRRGPLRRGLSHGNRPSGALAPGREVRSVFFGGGTPSLMAPSTVEAILEAHRQALDTRQGRRDHAGGQSDQRRGLAFQELQGGRRQPRLARPAGPQRHRPQGPGAPAHGRRGARRAQCRQQGFRAQLLRPHLCAARPDRGELEEGARDRALLCGRAPFPLSADDRARDDVRAHVRGRKAEAPGQ